MIQVRRTDRQTEGWTTLRKLTGALRDYVQLDNKHWYDHVPKSFETNHEGGATILWNLQVQTDRTVPSNKPDIIISDNKHGTCMLIDVAIPGDRNVIKKEAEKILKYKNLIIEIQRMWNVKPKVIPVIAGATGTISESLI